MPYTDTNVSNLIINKMTQAEYNALSTIDENQLYLITDGSGGSGTIEGAKIFYGTAGEMGWNGGVLVVSNSFTSDCLAPGTILIINITSSSVLEETQPLYLNINNLGGLPVYAQYRYSYTAVNCEELSLNGTYIFAYADNLYSTGGQWILVGGLDRDTLPTTYYIPAILCQTSASTAAKTSTYASYYTLRTGAHFEITMRYANSKAGALTLNINSTGAKPIYINGEASSSTNYTLPAGKYIVYYDGTNYHFRTDGHIPGTPNVLSGTATPATTDGLDGDIYIQYSV